jgi:hypothetical protein
MAVQGTRPNSAKKMRVNMRILESPPAARMKVRAWDSSGLSGDIPMILRARYASALVEMSPG